MLRMNGKFRSQFEGSVTDPQTTVFTTKFFITCCKYRCITPLWKTLWEIHFSLEFSINAVRRRSAKLARVVQYKRAASGIRG